MAEVEVSEFDRGKLVGREEGRVAQMLEQHATALQKISGSIERGVAESATLAAEVRRLGEEARLREERVVAAAEALAKETERRRSTLADDAASSDRRFTRGERLAGLLIAAIVAALAIYPYAH